MIRFNRFVKMRIHPGLHGALDILIECVSAIMGILFASSLSRSRIILVASRPSIKGMHTSISIAE